MAIIFGMLATFKKIVCLRAIMAKISIALLEPTASPLTRRVGFDFKVKAQVEAIGLSKVTVDIKFNKKCFSLVDSQESISLQPKHPQDTNVYILNWTIKPLENSKESTIVIYAKGDSLLQAASFVVRVV